MIRNIELAIVGNLLIDESLDHALVSVDDFTSGDLKLKKLFVDIIALKELEKPFTNLYRDNEFIELITDATDAGIITTAYTHNIESLRKINFLNFVKDIGKTACEVTEKNVINVIDEMDKLIHEYSVISGNTERVIDLDRNPYKSEDTIGTYVPTGFDGLDNASNDLPARQLSLVTGRSFEGKTTFVRQIIANAIHKQNKVLWIMGENYTKNEIERLYEFVIGNNPNYYDVVQRNKVYKKIPKQHVVEALSEWHKGKLRIIHKSECGLKTTDQLFSLITREVKAYKPALVVIDNLMSVLTAKSAEKLEKQGEFIQNCCDLSKNMDTHIQVVLHPNKGYRKGDNLEYENISGTMDIPNKADLIYVVRKNHDKEKNPNCDGYIDLIKNKVEGRTVTIQTVFDHGVNGLYEVFENGQVDAWSFDIEKYIKRKIKYWNGEEQQIDSKGWTK